MNELSHVPELDEIEEHLLVIWEWVIEKSINIKGKDVSVIISMGSFFSRHLNLSPNLLQLFGTLDVLS